MIHHTVGYYFNGTKKNNGVKCENLADHIEYNLKHRPGRAFFVDGVCLNKGYLSELSIEEIKQELKFEKAEKDTAPYK